MLDHERRRDLWTVKELAAAAGLSTGRLRQLLLAGELRGEKIGMTWAIRDGEAQRWLRSRTSDAMTP